MRRRLQLLMSRPLRATWVTRTLKKRNLRIPTMKTFPRAMTPIKLVAYVSSFAHFADIESLREIHAASFLQFDENKDSKLSADEYKKLFLHEEPEGTTEDVEAAFKHEDTDNDGFISDAEWKDSFENAVHHMGDTSDYENTDDEVSAHREVFVEMDANNDNELTMEELVNGLDKFYKDHPDVEKGSSAAELMEHLDADKSGTISLEEYLSPSFDEEEGVFDEEAEEHEEEGEGVGA
jgi:Ca2+-binding EF-hand superfamily protein